jgi:hypothetical protein
MGNTSRRPVSLTFWARASERAYVVDDAPDLIVWNAAVKSRHHRRLKAALDDGEDFAVGPAVVRLIIGEVPASGSARLRTLSA